MEYVHVFSHPETIEVVMLPPAPPPDPPLPPLWSSVVRKIKRNPWVLAKPLKLLTFLFFCLENKKTFI